MINVANLTKTVKTMASISLSKDGEETLEKIRDSFGIEPSKRKVVETALDEYWEQRKEELSAEQTQKEN